MFRLTIVGRKMKFLKLSFLFCIIFCYLFFSFYSCRLSSKDDPPLEDPADTNLVAGNFIELSEFSVTSDGSVIEIKTEEQSLSNITMVIGKDAYASKVDFKISQAPLIDLGVQNFIPASPLIRIDNGGVTSKSLVDINIPIKNDNSLYYVGCTYDEYSGPNLPLIPMETCQA